MIDLAELNDIKRSVSTGPDHEKIKSEVMDTLNMEISNLTNRIESGIVRSYRWYNTYDNLSASTVGARSTKFKLWAVNVI